MAHEGVPLVVIQRQLGQAGLGIAAVYLQGIDSVRARRAPMIPARAALFRPEVTTRPLLVLPHCGSGGKASVVLQRVGSVRDDAM